MDIFKEIKNSKTKFFPSISTHKIEKLEKKENNFEIMKTPEIIVQEEKGAQLLSLLLKADDPEWGETGTPLAIETIEYFKNNPVNQKILQTIRNLYREGVDEETLYNISLTYQHPERLEKVFQMISKYKPYIKNSQELQQKLFHVLEIFSKSFFLCPLEEKLNSEIEKDKKEQEDTLIEKKVRIESIISFFKPDSKTTGIKRISLMPSDPLDKIDIGSAYIFGEELVLKTNIDNLDNLEHEFLHSIINPIVEKLSKQLTEEQKEKISQLANIKLKQDYGEGYFSLLCEEFIRTYNNVFKKGEKPQNYEVFSIKISNITEDQFQKILIDDPIFKKRCEEFEIKTIKDFKNKSKEYFEKFGINKLRNLIFEFYQEYLNREDKDNENFEKFILDNFSNKI